MPRLIDHVRETIAAERLSFHMPGHKGGRGAPAAGVELFGEAVYAADLSELGGFDYLHGTDSAIARAQARAAELFGAERTWFLVNGATVGNLAALLATAGDGDAVLLARGSHRSVYAALTLSGARPVYLPPVRNEALDGLFGIDLDDVAQALAADPAIRVVHVTSPSFYGFTVPLAELAALSHAHGAALVVDEAHGTHLVFDDRFPTTALAAGADVVVHSPHKTLGSLTQSALVHLQGDRVDADRLDAALQMLQSSSPSALLTVSIDVAVEEMAARGRAQWATAIDLADTIRQTTADDGPVRVYGREVIGTPGIADYDPIKVVVDVHGLGCTGHDGAEWLRVEHGLHPEFADLRRIVWSITTADDASTAATLAAAIDELRHAPLGGTTSEPIISRWPHAVPTQACTPRDALHPRAETVALTEAVGRVSAEMVVPYPPGIPLLVPGEVVTADAIDSIDQLVRAGARLVGVADARGTALRCIV